MRTAIAREPIKLQAIRPRAENQPGAAALPEDPFACWRRRRPDQLSRKDSTSLRLAFAGTRIESEPRWQEVATGHWAGNSALAIGICIRQVKMHPINAVEVDLAVSATLACALLGDAASAILMSWALRHRAQIEPSCALLGDLWLIADF